MNQNSVYTVIDTNVIVSALLSKNPESNPVKIFTFLIPGRIIPLYNKEITNEYQDVLSRDKFPFRQEDIHII